MNLIISGVIAFIAAVFVGSVSIPVLTRLKFGQSIRDEGPSWHQKKSGTPTMGGVIFIIAAAVVSIIFARDMKAFGALLCGLLFGGIGFWDDYIKVCKKRNLGLTARQKFLAQIAAATFFLVFTMARGENADIFVPFTDISFPLGLWFLPLNVFLLVGIVNSVNLTDGLDGLAAFSSLVVAVFFAAFAKYAGEEGISVLMASLVGALAGFLIYNIHPAKVFMGDTGSLFLGGILSALVITGLSLLVTSVIYLTRDLSDDTARNIVTVCAFLSVFLSSAASGKRQRQRGLLTGALVGAGYGLCLYITGFLAFGFPGFSGGLLSTLALAVLSGAVGGIVGVNLKGRKKR